MLSRFHQPRPVAWLFFLTAFATCVAAGTWQVKRLQWKEGLITNIAEANTHAPITALPKEDAALQALQFRSVKLSGSWRGKEEFHLTPRYYRDQFGYHIIAPFTLNDGRVVMVNRGWVPGKQKLIESRPETAVRGFATITGMVRVGAERSYFTPINQPEKNVWFGRDVAEMAAHAGIKNIVPVMVDIVQAPAAKPSKNNAAPQVLPVPSDGTIRLRNDHLSYVITWYGIALGILVIFLTYHRKTS